MKNLKWAILTLAIIPAASVVITIMLLAHKLLELPYIWSLLMGLVSCAVSPAVIVPLMLLMQENRLGTLKGIPSAVIAACTVCSVVALCGFGLVLGLVFSSGSLIFNVLHVPLEIAVGCSYGFVVGVTLWYIPAPTATDKPSTAVSRFILLLAAGIAAVCCAKALNITGAGVLGCLLTALVCAYGWAKHGAATVTATTSNKKSATDIQRISIALKFIWLYAFQPLLFGLIGAAVAIQKLNLQLIVSALIIIAVAHAVQLTVTFAAVSMRFGFTLRERIFLALSWIPKATIQAAIGSVALDTVREYNSSGRPRPPEEEQYATIVLTIAVLSILITAPLGALAIALSGKYLLDKDATAVVLALSTAAVSQMDEQGRNSSGQDTTTRDTLAAYEQHMGSCATLDTLTSVDMDDENVETSNITAKVG